MSKKILYIIISITMCLPLVGCSTKTDPSTIGELAYDINKTHGYTTYVKENNQYVPYLVLTNDYNGNTLLLRKEALPQDCQFSKVNDNDNDYYAESNVDSYLNSEYYNTLSDSVKEIITTSKIQITKDYPDISEVEEIERKIFLLSCTEVNIDLSIVNTEGIPLEYFAKKEHMLCQNGENYVGWWLRSNYLPERSMVCCISDAGVIGGEGVQYSGGVRPAFCIPSSSTIIKKQISSDLEGYVLNIEK